MSNELLRGSRKGSLVAEQVGGRREDIYKRSVMGAETRMKIWKNIAELKLKDLLIRCDFEGRTVAQPKREENMME